MNMDKLSDAERPEPVASTGLEQYRAALRNTKRQSIISAAMDLFLEEGFEQAGMAAIAKLADVSTATLYKHFASKQALFAAIIETIILELKPELRDVSAENDDPRDSLRELGHMLAKLLMGEKVVPTFRMVIAEAYRFPELRDLVYAHAREPFRRAVRTVLEKGITDGHLDIEEDHIFIAVEQYMGQLYWFLLYSRVMDQQLALTERQVHAIIEENVKTFYARYRV